MRLLHCPICKDKAIIRKDNFNYKYKYYVYCDCPLPLLKGSNPIDLTESWNRLVKMIKAVQEIRGKDK